MTGFFGRFLSYGLRGFLSICWLQGQLRRKLGLLPDSSLIYPADSTVSMEAWDIHFVKLQAYQIQ